ncbi:Na-translocating system protein MpsC family protein [Bacillus fonticola]|uniref:Na-translocating system protein MpsC family protein n=1 Tax=Bacillus fonticola TaxID=2728853 RepID=UPI001473E550|nr:Na-translocating system protein MpsC family protein [Bacillus fonticola]
MNMNTLLGRQERLTYLSSSFSKLLKKSFGKGPKMCYTTMDDRHVYVYIQHFLTPSEHVLRKSGDFGQLVTYRSIIMEDILVQFKQEVKKVVGVEYDRCLFDWNYDQNVGLVMLVKSESNVSKRPPIQLMEEPLQKKVTAISMENHKVPKKMALSKVNASFYVLEMKGTLHPVERTLYKRGYLSILLESSYELNQVYRSYWQDFEKIFKKQMSEFFILWDYQEDACYMLFFLE